MHSGEYLNVAVKSETRIRWCESTNEEPDEAQPSADARFKDLRQEAQEEGGECIVLIATHTNEDGCIVGLQTDE